MPSTKNYKDFILKQLSEVPNITCRSMMGEFLLYADGTLFGGIYDDRLLIKIVPETAKYHLSKDLPYPGAKPMHLIEDPDDKPLLTEIILTALAALVQK